MQEFTHLLLDLDDTLYPNSTGVWEAVLERIQQFLERRLSLQREQAKELRQRYLDQFGTTLTGLREEFSVDTEDYLHFVHDIPYDELLTPDPALEVMLRSITIPRVIFTNAYLPHAEKVLTRLGIPDEIDEIIDIYALDFNNKPRIEGYYQALEILSAHDPSTVVFVDDRPANLAPAKDLAMTTVLVGTAPQSNAHLHITRITDLLELLPGLRKASNRGQNA